MSSPQPQRRPVRVLSVIRSFRPAFSGEGEWWLRLIPFLRERGVEVEILTSGEAKDGGPERVEGVSVHRVPIMNGPPGLRGYAGKLVAGLLALRQRRRRFDVALFHALSRDMVFASCVAGRLGGWRVRGSTEHAFQRLSAH